jgi:hypothetical protein
MIAKSFIQVTAADLSMILCGLKTMRSDYCTSEEQETEYTEIIARLTRVSLEQFRATRSTTRNVDDLYPSNAPASEVYSYDWDGQIWWIRCEGGEYVFSWTHPCNEARPTLAEAEAALFDSI